MNWTEILGLIGGGAGIVALIKAGIDIYNAKSNRTTVDISNMEKMLNDSISRYEKLEQKFDEFQNKSHGYVEGLRARILGIEKRCQSQEDRINNMEKVINLAWRCDYAPKIEDCPVIKEYEKRRLCEDCEHHKKED